VQPGPPLPIFEAMPVPNHRLDFEYSSSALSEQIMRGALARDPVRLERAITAALEIHGGAEHAERSVFAQARRAAAGLGPESGAAVAAAIDAYVNRRRAT
jgi:hypothetical protein